MNADPQAQTHRPSSRRSLSQASIPLSALVSPHAPSVGRSGSYHMRDPRKPPPIQSTAWSLTFPSLVQEGEPRWAWKGWVERGGSPLHAWLFFIGFILFPLWWLAAFIPVRRTRRLGGTDVEKGVVLDDPQLEHGVCVFKICQDKKLLLTFFFFQTLNHGEDGVASWLGCLLSLIYHLLFLSLFLPENCSHARRGLLTFQVQTSTCPSSTLLCSFQSCTIFLSR